MRFSDKVPLASEVLNARTICIRVSPHGIYVFPKAVVEPFQAFKKTLKQTTIGGCISRQLYALQIA
jgi:hypothetical protein